MAIEKSWSAVAPQLFTSDGNTLGVVNIASTAGFKVKQTVAIAQGAPSTLQVQVQVKRVVSSTQLIVGPLLSSLQPPYKQEGASLLSKRENISAYTVASGAYIYAAEQPKVLVPINDIIQAVYRQEPGTAIGVELDDQFGNPIDSVVDNDGIRRLAVDAEITVESIEIGTVDQGAPNTPANAWPVEVYGPNGHPIEPNVDGSVNVDISKSIGLFNLPYDSIAVTYPSATVENYQSYVGGLTGTPVQLVVVTYSDSTKNDITSVVRTPAGP